MTHGFGRAFGLCGLLASLSPLTAHAGPNEELMQLVLHPSDPNIMLVRYENAGDGIFYSRDGGETFTMLCASAIADDEDRPLLTLGPLAIGGDGAVLMGLFSGLYADSAGNGCGWQRSPAVDNWVSDLVAHPADPGAILGITSRGGQMNGLFRRTADGSFEELGTKLEMLLNRLHVVPLPGGGVRVYISAVDGQLPIGEPDAGDSGLPGRTAPNYVILHSDDLGETWTSNEVGIVDGALRLEAVDPSNPDRIVINIARDRDPTTNEPLPDSLMVSDDRGESFSEWTTVMALGGITIANDGRVYVGERGDNFTSNSPKGIRVAPQAGVALELLTDQLTVRCLHLRGDELFVCQKFSFGTVSTEDGSFTPTLELIKAEALVSCDGVDMGATCRQQLCTGYCGSAHFPLSPMCGDNYQSTIEGCQQPVSSGGEGGAGGAGAISGAVDGGAGSGGGTAAGTSGSSDAGGTMGNAGTDGTDVATAGGCGCRVSVGAKPRDATGIGSSVIWLMAAAHSSLLWWRRRSRGR